MRLTGVLLMAGLLAGLYNAPADAKDAAKAPAATTPAPAERDDYLTRPPIDPLAVLDDQERRWKAGEEMWTMHPDGPDTRTTQADFDKARAKLAKPRVTGASNGR